MLSLSLTCGAQQQVDGIWPLQLLFRTMSFNIDVAGVLENLFSVSTEEFFSKKITNKLVQQLQVRLCSLAYFSYYVQLSSTLPYVGKCVW